MVNAPMLNYHEELYLHDPMLKYHIVKAYEKVNVSELDENFRACSLGRWACPQIFWGLNMA